MTGCKEKWHYFLDYAIFHWNAIYFFNGTLKKNLNDINLWNESFVIKHTLYIEKFIKVLQSQTLFSHQDQSM